MVRRVRVLASIVLLLPGAMPSSGFAGDIQAREKEHRPAAEIRPMLEPIAKEYPGAFLAAVYSLPETKEVFFSVIGEASGDPWKYRSIGSFDLHTSPTQKRAVILDTARKFEEASMEECDRVAAAIRWWCEADRILDLAGAGFGAFFSAGATAHLMERVRPRVPYEPTPESLAVKLDPEERFSLYKDVLTEVALLGPAERMRFFSEVFAYMAEHPRNRGD
ncbi:MAG: hypothetical protein ABIK65_15580 [Candidatus Eisenbacteria bacterium]